MDPEPKDGKRPIYIPCMICGTFVELNERECAMLMTGNYRPYKICKDCKDAVAFAKNAMKNRE